VLTADQLRRLEAIHRHEYDRFRYVSDAEKWGTQEHWLSCRDVAAMATGRSEGDCEDFAAIVRAACREAGIPTRLVFCWVPKERGYHIVLEADGWISDCNRPYLTERDIIDNYEWISLSGYEPGEPWHYVKGFDTSAPWPHLR